MSGCRTTRLMFRFAALAAAVAHGGSVETRADVVVETTSGRVFRGRFDHRTTAERLVLRTGTAQMYVTRPIQWSRVSRVRLDGAPLSPKDVIARFDAQGWPSAAEEEAGPELPGPSAPPPPQPDPPRPSRDAGAYEPAPMYALPEATPSYQTPALWPRNEALPRATSLHIDATVGKWRSYADSDGIVLRVSPRDAFGNVVPVSGTVEVDLIGMQSATRTRGEPFPRLARWVRRIVPDDVVGFGATYRLPFQARHPEFDLELGSLGAVHARLVVPGQGVFDDTATMVWVRPFDTTRDQLQMRTRGRFFAPLERTSRGMNGSRLGVVPPP